MAEKRANPHAQDGDEFEIAADEKGKQPLRVRLQKGKAELHEVWQKDLPKDLPARWVDPEDGEEKAITWLNNFGVKDKKSGKFIERLDYDYEVEFDLPEGSKAVYFDGKAVRFFESAERKDGKVKVRLNLGDPPTGRLP
jgi:hypothetical protein